MGRSKFRGGAHDAIGKTGLVLGHMGGSEHGRAREDQGEADCKQDLAGQKHQSVGGRAIDEGEDGEACSPLAIKPRLAAMMPAVARIAPGRSRPRRHHRACGAACRDRQSARHRLYTVGGDRCAPALASPGKSGGGGRALSYRGTEGVRSVDGRARPRPRPSFSRLVARGIAGRRWLIKSAITCSAPHGAGKFRPRTDAQLVVDGLGLVADGGRCAAQHLRRLLVGCPAGEQVRHFALARREPVELG